MKTVVITGCLGMIGLAVTQECLRRGCHVLGIDSETYASNPEYLANFEANGYGPQFTYLKEDICDLKSLPDCDYVINLAAETHVANSIVNSDVFLKTNVLGVQNLLNLIKNKPNNVCNRPVFIHFSTDEVYGDIAEGFHTEADLLKPSNPYSASKASADMLVLAWARTYNINYVIVRPTNNYGFGQHPEKLIPLCVKLLRRGKKIRLHNEGKPIRTWLASEDTARAVATIIESGVKNEIYNVSGNIELPNRETVELIIKHFLQAEPESYEPFLDLSYVREGQDVRYALSDQKIRHLGWQPEEDFKEKLERLVSYYKNQPYRW